MPRSGNLKLSLQITKPKTKDSKIQIKAKLRPRNKRMTSNHHHNLMAEAIKVQVSAASLTPSLIQTRFR